MYKTTGCRAGHGSHDWPRGRCRTQSYQSLWHTKSMSWTKFLLFYSFFRSEHWFFRKGLAALEIILWISSFSNLQEELLQFATNFKSLNLDHVFQPIPSRIEHKSPAPGSGFFLLWGIVRDWLQQFQIGKHELFFPAPPGTRPCRESHAGWEQSSIMSACFS